MEKLTYCVYATDMSGNPLPDVVVTVDPQAAGTAVYREFWVVRRRPWWRGLLRRCR